MYLYTKKKKKKTKSDSEKRKKERMNRKNRMNRKRNKQEKQRRKDNPEVILRECCRTQKAALKEPVSSFIKLRYSVKITLLGRRKKGSIVTLNRIDIHVVYFLFNHSQFDLYLINEAFVRAGMYIKERTQKVYMDVKRSCH